MNPSPEQTKQDDQTAEENEQFRAIKELGHTIEELKRRRETRVKALGELFFARLEEEGH